MISSPQRPPPDNPQHSQQTNIHAPGGIQTHDLVGERPQTYALDRAATGTGVFVSIQSNFLNGTSFILIEDFLVFFSSLPFQIEKGTLQ